MPKNKAQEELEGLLAMQGDAQDSAANLAKVQDARRQFASTGADDADFALPEAGATAIAAGFLLGPIGGLAMGLAQGFLIKNERQNIIDQVNAENEQLALADQIVFEEFDRAALAAQNPEDVRQISALQTEYSVARRVGDPERMQSAIAGLTEFEAKNEEQRIAAEEFDAQMRRDMDQETYNRHRSLLGDFQAESGNFEAQQATANNILESMNKGDGASVTAALATLPLLVNPDAGATTEAEVEIWQKIGGTVDGLIGRVQKELGTGGLTDPTRREIIEVTQQYKRNSIAFQQAREARYGRAISTENIPDKYRAQYNLSGQLPVVQQGGFIRGEELQEGSENNVADLAVETAQTGARGVKDFVTSKIDNASMAIGDWFDRRKHEKAWREEFFRIHGRAPTAADNQGVGN